MIDKLIPDPPHTFEETLLRLFDLLRSAAAVIYESGDQLEGSRCDLPFAAMYLVDMAKALVNELLSRIHENRTASLLSNT
jgi:hypothetical protein